MSLSLRVRTCLKIKVVQTRSTDRAHHKILNPVINNRVTTQTPSRRPCRRIKGQWLPRRRGGRINVQVK